MIDPVSAILERSGLLQPGECLRCEVCCRFPAPTSPLAPYFSHAEAEAAVAAGISPAAFLPGRYGPGSSARLVPDGATFRCPAFRPATNDCTAYPARPLDCRLYPFILMYDPAGKEVWLGLDTYCPAVTRLRIPALENPQAPSSVPRIAPAATLGLNIISLTTSPPIIALGPELGCQANYLREEGGRDDAPASLPRGIYAAAADMAMLLDGPMLQSVVEARGIVGDWKEHVRPVRSLPNLARALCGTDFGLARLTLAARERLAPFFVAHRSALSHHAFAPIWVWSDLFDLRYKISGERLLIFAEGDGDCFLIGPPFGAGDCAAPANEAAQIMRELAPRAASPRIQEADDATAAELVRAGWRIRETSEEYLYPRGELADLRGNRYEKKRQLCNRFERGRTWRWRAFEPDHLPAALSLYGAWLTERTAAHPGEFYAAQAEASWRAVSRGLRDAEALELVARVLEAEGKMAGFTAGCALHDGRLSRHSLGDGGTFHVLFEISDLSVKGAAQFMFRELCREMRSFETINAGSASGLDNLARVKESYRPSARLPVHTLVPPT